MTTTIEPNDLRRILQLPFTEEQLDAITAPPAPSVVIAGAGSGKTAVMSARVAWLVATGVGPPESVLGLTFTNKAAAELAQRVRRSLHLLATSGFLVPEGEPTVSTYHSYAAALLREYGLRAGYEPAARLLADAARYQLAERVVRRAAGPFLALKLRVPALTAAVVALDGELNEHLADRQDVIAHDRRLLQVLADIESEQGSLTARPLAVRRGAEGRGELLGLVAEYRAEKQRLEVVDFGDQMAGAARLAEGFPEVGTVERERFPAVLLDEYQDTSIAQKRLLLHLFEPGHPITAVGDPFQAIYGWRGASVRNIATFAQEFSATKQPAPVFSLSQNNRSDERILDLANVMAAPLRDAHPQVVPLRVRSDRAQQGTVIVGLYATRDDEVAALAEDIAGRVAGGEQPRDIAVLCRETSAFPALHQALTERELPVEVVGLGGLLELPEIVDLVSTLEVIDDPSANPALVRLLTGPRWRIGPRDLALLGHRARQLVAQRGGPAPAAGLAHSLLDAVSGIDPAEVISLAEAIHDPGPGAYSPAARERFALLDAECADLRSNRSGTLPELVQRVLEVSGLAVELAATPQARRTRRSDHLVAFQAQVAAFADLEGSATLGSFLAFITASLEYQGGLDSTAPAVTNSIKVMTVHKAKGLEWPTVYVPNLCERTFPSTRGRRLWPTTAQVLPYSLRGDSADFPTVTDWVGNKGFDRFREEMKRRDAVEERRLAYVGFTRAQHTVVLSGHWWGPHQIKPRGPSEYLLSAHEFCMAGGGEVRHWQPPPGDGDTNPARAKNPSFTWPVEFDAESRAGREQGARWVRAAMAGEVQASAPTPVEPGQQVTFDEVLADREFERAVQEWDEDLAALVNEARELHRPDREVMVPTRLSASALVRLASDPDGLARDLARPMPRRPAPAARRGTRFHLWVESLFGQGSLIDLDDLDEGDRADDATDLAALQQAFLAGPYADLAPAAVEAPFQLVLGSHAISGRIDAVYQNPHGAGESTYEVVDWKTGTSTSDPLQLAIYRLAWAELHGIPLDQVSAAFYYVARGVIERPDDLPDRAALTTLLSSDAIPGDASGQYPPSV